MVMVGSAAATAATANAPGLASAQRRWRSRLPTNEWLPPAQIPGLDAGGCAAACKMAWTAVLEEAPLLPSRPNPPAATAMPEADFRAYQRLGKSSTATSKSPAYALPCQALLCHAMRCRPQIAHASIAGHCAGAKPIGMAATLVLKRGFPPVSRRLAAWELKWA